MLKHFWNKFKNCIKLSYFTSAQSDGAHFYNAQVTSLNSPTQSVIWYPYGLYASAPKNTMGVTLNIQGNEENQVTFPHYPDQRFLGLSDGEVLIGNPLTQTSIKFDEEGNVEITSLKEVTINASSLTTIKSTNTIIQGDLTVTGNINSEMEMSAFSGSGEQIDMSDIKSVFNEHIHVDSMGGDTSNPTTQI